MFKLRIFKKSNLVKELVLEPEQIYIAGRGENCQIQLDNDPGISRQHFQIAFVDGQWRVDVLSKFGELYFDQQKVSGVALSDGAKFSTPPYEYIYQEGDQSSSEVENSDRTMVASLPSVAYLRLVDSRGGLMQSYRLAGEAWVAGRDTTCSIFLDNSKISRRQFEMYKESDNYFIRDLGSANGTLVNGKAISGEEWTLLNSGDQIKVIDWQLNFELHDSSFDKKLSQVRPDVLHSAVETESDEPAVAEDVPQQDYVQNVPSPQLYENQQYSEPINNGPVENTTKAKFDIKNLKAHLNPVRIAMLGLLILGLGFYLFQSNEPNENKVSDNKKSSSPFDQLDKENKQYVIQAYNRGKELFKQGKYQLAKEEITKLHAILPSGYEESKQVANIAQQALDNLEEQRKLDEAEKQKVVVEQKIQSQVAECRSTLKLDTIELEQLEMCLTPVLEFNPEHPQIVALRNEVQRLVEDRKLKESAEEENKEKIRKQNQLFAQSMLQANKAAPRDAIKILNRVVVSPYPDPNQTKKKAAARIESIKNKMREDGIVFQKQADEFFKQGKIKEGVLALKKVAEVDPENPDIAQKITNMTVELSKVMQPMYHDAIVEESIGELEVAKQKWKKILDQSFAGEEYFNKSRIKLRKHGVLGL
jgi:pSer/pThr/pTyr-binding forkhead associated (FHA) protein/tetratricopeptide (TPR) repeat protein